MARPSTLFYFTHSYPYGIGESWKHDELRHLARHFDRTVVIPLCFAGNRSPRRPPPGVEALEPILDEPVSGRVPEIVPQLLASPRRGYYVREFNRARVWRRRSWLRAWATAGLQMETLLRDERVRSLMHEIDHDAVLVFFWGRGLCDLVPHLPVRPRQSVVRMHRYDLFETENDGYIPFRRPLLESVTTAAPSSQAGQDHLRSLYPDLAERIEAIRMGSVGAGRARPSDDGVLRLVTCSFVAPVKRLGLLVDALSLVRARVDWTHVGDGPLYDELRGAAATLPTNVTTNFAGRMHAADVLPFYDGRCLDLFVNVSTSEGVPFSIMEAMSCGIPVLATDVGGTGEIIDDGVGRLVPKEITANKLADEIDRFASLPSPEREQLRRAVHSRWRERCDADVLAEEFADFLVSGRRRFRS